MLIQTAVRNLRDKTHDQGIKYLDSDAVFYVEAAEPGVVRFQVGLANAKTVKLHVDEDLLNVTRTGCSCGKNKPKSPCAHVAAALIHLDAPDAKEQGVAAQARIAQTKAANARARLDGLRDGDLDLVSKAIQSLINRTYLTLEDLRRLLPLVDRDAYLQFLIRSLAAVPDRFAAFAKTLSAAVPDGAAAGAQDVPKSVLTKVGALDDLALSADALHGLIDANRELEQDLIDTVMPQAELGYSMEATMMAFGAFERALDGAAYRKNEGSAWTPVPLSEEDRNNLLLPFVGRLQIVLDNLERLYVSHPMLAEATAMQVAMIFLETNVREDFAAYAPLAAQVKALLQKITEVADPEMTKDLLLSFGQTPLDYRDDGKPTYLTDADFLALLNEVKVQTAEEVARKTALVKRLGDRVAKHLPHGLTR